jgi:hypothetical protein
VSALLNISQHRGEDCTTFPVVAFTSLVDGGLGDYISLLVSESSAFFASVAMDCLCRPAKETGWILLVKSLDPVLSCGWCHIVVVGETTKKTGGEWQEKRE